MDEVLSVSQGERGQKKMLKTWTPRRTASRDPDSRGTQRRNRLLGRSSHRRRGNGLVVTHLSKGSKSLDQDLGHPRRTTSVTRAKLARGQSRRSARLMSFGVRRDVVLSRWEIQVTMLRAESSQPPACRSRTTVGKRKPFRWHRLAVVWIVHFRFSCPPTFWEVVVGLVFRVAGRRQVVLSRRQESDVSRSVIAGSMWKTV